MENFNSGVLIPLGAFAVAIVAVISGALSNAHAKRVQAEQRMAMLQRGMPIADIERLLGSRDEPATPRDPLRRIVNTRTAAMVLISSGTGIILFFVVLTMILHEHDVLSGAAAGLVPLAIGAGFAVDYRLQAREVARLGLDLPGVNQHQGRVL